MYQTSIGINIWSGEPLFICTTFQSANLSGAANAIPGSTPLQSSSPVISEANVKVQKRADVVDENNVSENLLSLRTVKQERPSHNGGNLFS